MIYSYLCVIVLMIRCLKYILLMIFVDICDTRAQNLSFIIFGFLLNHILHCICFKIHFTVSEYLVSNWSYTHLIRTFKKVKKLNKKFNIFHVIIIVRNHCFIYSEIIQHHKGLYSVSNKTNGIKIWLQFYNLWQIHGHQLNWRIANSNTPLLYSGL